MLNLINKTEEQDKFSFLADQTQAYLFSVYVKLAKKLVTKPHRSQGLRSQLDVYDVLEGCCRLLLWTDSLFVAYSSCKVIKLKAPLAVAYYTYSVFFRFILCQVLLLQMFSAEKEMCGLFLSHKSVEPAKMVKKNHDCPHEDQDQGSPPA